MDVSDLILIAKARDLASSGQARERRLGAALSLQEIADVVGCSAAAVWRWERGTRSPRGAAAARYAELLDELAASAR